MSLIVHVGLAQAQRLPKIIFGAGCRTMYFHTHNLHHQTEKSRVNYNSGFFFWVSLKNPSDGVSTHGPKGQCRTIRAWLLPEGNHRESYGWTLSGREKPPKTHFSRCPYAGGRFIRQRAEGRCCRGTVRRQKDEVARPGESEARSADQSAVPGCSLFLLRGAFCFLRRGFDFPVFRCKLYGLF